MLTSSTLCSGELKLLLTKACLVMLQLLPQTKMLDLSKLKAYSIDKDKILQIIEEKTRCACETLMPPKHPLLRNMTLIFDLDLCR